MFLDTAIHRRYRRNLLLIADRKDHTRKKGSEVKKMELFII